MSCPICKKATDHDFRPFCSKHCSDVDLGRWFSETYVVAGDPDEVEGNNEADFQAMAGRVH